MYKEFAVEESIDFSLVSGDKLRQDFCIDTDIPRCIMT